MRRFLIHSNGQNHLWIRWDNSWFNPTAKIICGLDETILGSIQRPEFICGVGSAVPTYFLASLSEWSTKEEEARGTSVSDCRDFGVIHNIINYFTDSYRVHKSLCFFKAGFVRFLNGIKIWKYPRTQVCVMEQPASLASLDQTTNREPALASYSYLKNAGDEIGFLSSDYRDTRN